MTYWFISNPLTRKHRYVGNGSSQLQQRLASLCVIDPGCGRFPPGLVALKMQPHTVKCRAGFPVGPGTMREDVINQFVDSPRVVAILKRSQQARMLAPVHTNGRKSFRPNKIFRKCERPT